jgi:hypothetical protein
MPSHRLDSREAWPALEIVQRPLHKHRWFHRCALLDPPTVRDALETRYGASGAGSRVMSSSQARGGCSTLAMKKRR